MTFEVRFTYAASCHMPCVSVDPFSLLILITYFSQIQRGLALLSFLHDRSTILLLIRWTRTTFALLAPKGILL